MGTQLGKLLMVIGGTVLLAGLVIYLLPNRSWGLGRLPGDIRIERGNFRFYFPITTCLLLTLLLNLVIWVIRKLF